jgi:hypothetical protein
MLSRLPMTKLAMWWLPSNMGRSALIATSTINNETVRPSPAHARHTRHNTHTHARHARTHTRDTLTHYSPRVCAGEHRNRPSGELGPGAVSRETAGDHRRLVTPPDETEYWAFVCSQPTFWGGARCSEIVDARRTDGRLQL